MSADMLGLVWYLEVCLPQHGALTCAGAAGKHAYIAKLKTLSTQPAHPQ